jgi:hypothetical protein
MVVVVVVVVVVTKLRRLKRRITSHPVFLAQLAVAPTSNLLR